MKNYLVEFIGTFFLVFTIACVVLSNAPNVVPGITIGFILMVMVYAGGHISGGHYNPAVSLAASIRGALPFKDFIPYAISQVLGGIVAILTVRHIMVPDYAARHVNFNLLNLTIAEFLFTFALCYTVLLCATDKKVAGNSYYGLAIGSTVMVGIFAVSTFCISAFNPAVAISVAFVGLTGWKTAILTAFVNLAAGTAAAYTYKFVSNGD